MTKKQQAAESEQDTTKAERGEVLAGEGASRGRPGRRTGAERRDAVLSILSGKSSVDQVARQYGVLPTTVASWRDDALLGIEEALRSGSGPSPRERELEREVAQLKEVVGTLSVERALAKQAIDEWKRTARPTRARRSRG